MFVEVVQGMVTDPLKVHQLLDRWVSDIAPQAPGWHDTTAGVAADGRFIAMIRFDSTAAPIPGHDQWRAETMALLNGETSDAVYDRVVVLKEGAVGTAGFVQFVLGRVHDLAAANAYLKDFDEIVAPLRPDSTGRLMASRDDGQFIGAFTFSSELDARAGEAQVVSPSLAEMKRRGAALGDGRAEYIDLTDPWVYLPVRAPQATRERSVDPLNIRLLSKLETATVLDAVIRAVEPVAGRLVAREPVRRILHGDSTGVPVHLIVRDLPYGAWFMAQFLDLFSDPGSTQAARRLVGLGVLTAVPTAITGWAEWALADSSTRRVGIIHAAAQAGAMLTFLGSWAARANEHHALGVYLARLGGIGLVIGGFLGGHMARDRRAETTAPTRNITLDGLDDRS
jgi:hypothetical protein